MKDIFTKFKKSLKEFMFPSQIHCFCCGSEIFVNSEFCLCENCVKELVFLQSCKTCKVCGIKINGIGNLCERCTNNTFKYFKLARSVFEYSDEMVNVIHNLKFNNKQYLSKSLSNILKNYFDHSIELSDTDIIIPVPLHPKRLNQRGYNQTELLLESFVDCGKVCFDCVKRVVETESQRTKNAKDRFENMKNCFEVFNKQAIKNKNVLICDDVFTTGATCNSLARTLLKAGAKQVKCLTLASTTKKIDGIDK
ncbi:MAG: ComF family protein [Christensenellales bacterium]